MIFVAADHRGFAQKKSLLDRLAPYSPTDLGALSYQPDDDFPIITDLICQKILLHHCLGVIFCGSGIGVSIAANKHRGIRAGLCLSPRQAMAARRDDHINLLCLSVDFSDPDTNYQTVTTFLDTPIASEERFLRRLSQIADLEKQLP